MGRNYTSAKMAPLGWNHAPGTGAAMRRVGISKLGLSEEHASDLLGYLFADWYCDRTGDSVPGRRLFAERRCEMWHAVAGANSAASRAIQWQSLDDQCLFLSRCGTILRPGKRVQPADEHGWTRITPFV